MNDESDVTAEGSALERIVMPLLRLGVEGFGPFASATASADEALRKSKSKDAAVKRLINTHVAAAAAQGFVTNLGGLATLPVALPANVSATYLDSADA